VSHDAVHTVLPSALLALELVGVSTGALPHATLLALLLLGSATHATLLALLALLGSAAAATLADVVATVLKHALGVTGNAGVDVSTVGWASLALVRGRLLAPFPGADVRGPKPLIVHVAGIRGADREALVGTKEALLSAVTLHDGTLVALGGDLAPAGPWNTAPTTVSVSSPS
jgi:hypothetical protein